MNEIQLSHKDNTHITTITEYELTQILQYAENWATSEEWPTSANRNVENTIKFLQMSLNLK